MVYLKCKPQIITIISQEYEKQHDLVYVKHNILYQGVQYYE